MIRGRVVEAVYRFARLEVDVWVLAGAADHRPIGAEGAGAVGTDLRSGHQLEQLAVAERLDLLDLVGGAKAIEHMQERQPAAQAEPGGNGGKVARLLHRRRAENPATAAAGGHHVAVIAKDRQALGRQGAGRHVQHRRGELPRQLVEVGDHQQQPLAGREGGGERPGLQGAMHRAGSARFALQLHHRRHGAPEVGPALCGPGISPLTHRRGRRDRVDGDHLIEAVGHPGHGLVAINRE